MTRGDRYNVVEWKRTKYGCDFIVRLQSANPLPDSSGLTSYLSEESSQLTEQSESANSAFEIANEDVESANGLAPLSLTCRTSLSTSSGGKPVDKALSLREQIKDNSNSQTSGTSSPNPNRESTQTSRTHAAPFGRTVAPLHSGVVLPALSVSRAFEIENPNEDYDTADPVEVKATVPPRQPRRSQAELDRILEARRRAVHGGRHFHVEDDDHSELDD